MHLHKLKAIDNSIVKEYTMYITSKGDKTMTKFIAAVMDSYDRQLMNIEKEYETKNAFESYLKGNGYKIRFITTEEKFDEECEKYHERIKRQNTIRKDLLMNHARNHQKTWYAIDND